MTGLFDALEFRFDSNSKLRLYGRKLFEGFQDQERPNVTRPYTEVSYEMADDLSTFETDVEVYDLRFRYFAKALQSNAATNWIKYMREVFREGNLYGPELLTAGMRLRRATGPMLRGGLYDAEMNFEWIVERRVNSPVTVRT